MNNLRDNLRKKDTENFDEASQKLVSDKEFNDELKKVFALNKEAVINEPDETIPMLTLYFRKEYGAEFELVVVGFAHFDENRHKAMLGLGAKIYDEYCVAKKLYPAMIFLSSEAHVAMATKLEERQKYDRVENMPGAKEVTFTAGLTLDQRVNQAQAEIFHTNGKRALIREVITEWDKDRVAQQRMPILEQFYFGLALAQAVHKKEKQNETI